MSYIVIEVYSFACDGRRPDGRACPVTYDCTPAAQAPPRLLDEAHRQLRAEGWTVKTIRGTGYLHLCPEAHAGDDTP